MVKQRMMKKFEELVFSDNFMFGKVMEDSGLCKEVLECLLQRDVDTLTTVETEKEIKYTSGGKPIRLDVYNEDSDGSVYDVEMENLNKKTIESHQLPQRSRFYQASIDVDFLEKKNSYKTLPHSDVIFICTFDPFRQGLCKYTFHERCDEKIDIFLNDGTAKTFFNCTYDGNDVSDELKELYLYIRNGKPTGRLTKKIDEAVMIGRRNELWRTQYMREWVALQDAKDEGREEGREEGQLLAYMELVKDGDISIEKAASRFGISPEKFRKMMDEKSLFVV